MIALQGAVYEYSVVKKRIAVVCEQPAANCPAATAAWIRECTGLHQQDQECLIAIMLNVKNRPLAWSLIFKGSVSDCMAYPREIFRGAIIANATSIIIAHNHPSGSATPSDRDRSFTLNLKAAGQIVGIDLLDHIIVTENEFYSFQEKGWA